ncbi:ADP/ATP carrier protein [Tulasnella sp. 424]|nr:ADP/ATP carrier protein [Tulasnella sp. 424]KAG8981212.1 ADP/ATP carrier protein [Tulasnella sp. 425]
MAQEQLTPFGHALAGALGGVFSNAAVYPLDTVKTRIQATEEKGKDRGAQAPSVFQLLRKILHDEGLRGYYKGFGASMLNTFSMQYAYFFFYSFVRGSYLKRLSKKHPNQKLPSISAAMELVIGAIAGALAQVFTIPVAVIATRQQLAEDPASNDAEKALGKTNVPKRDNSFFGVAREIIDEDGVTGLWTGLRPGLVLTVNPAITYGVFERLKTSLVPQGKGMSPWMAFTIGALSKTLATVATYPYIMAKVRLQARSNKDTETQLSDSEKASLTDTEAKPAVPHKPRYNGAIDVLRKVRQEKGIVGWYQGMSAQITKAVLSQALLFMLKDQFERYALFIMILWRRLSS